MPTVRLSNGKSFNASEGVSLLEAASLAGLALEHSCRSGRCRTCKARVSSGTVASVKDDLSLAPEERSAGWILTCATGATSDVQLEIEDVGLPPGIAVKTLPSRIEVLERLAPDVMKVVLRLPPTASFAYAPGQYIEIIGKGHVRRSYSIANAANRSGQLELQVRQIEGGVLSAYWFEQAKVNDLLRFEGPRGTFFLRDVSGLDLVFLATGTGIAPIKAMLEDLVGRPAADQPRSVSLYWGGRRPVDHYWRPESSSPVFRFIPVLSRADASWTGGRGHVQQVLMQEQPEWQRTVVYACGASVMVDSAAAALADAGLPPGRFFADAFVSSN